MTNKFAEVVAYKTLKLLDERRARVDLNAVSFYVWVRSDRLVVIFDPNAVDLRKLNEEFAHGLSTHLQGRIVKRTNSRGMFLQVGYDIPLMQGDLSVVDMDLSKQKSPFDMPMGMSARGEMWISLLEGDSFLVSGSRGLGKTGLLHGWIQALQKGGKTEIYAHDGKRGVEFSRYMGADHFHMVLNLADTLRRLSDEAMKRRRILLSSGHANIVSYNEAHPNEPISPIALFVDEAALTNDEEKASLVEIVERERDTGFYPILATNRPEAAALLVKTNLVTRICFPVPSWNASQMVLGMNGAETLPKIQGRGLIVFKARVTEFQSFRVEYPEPSEETVQLVLKLNENSDHGNGEKYLDADLLQRAQVLKNDGMSLSAIINDLWGNPGGAAFYERIRLLREALGT
jgi:hypothetical protein